MALIDDRAVGTHIRWDRSHRPREVRGDGHHLTVVSVDRIRDERAAYPAGRGPRLTLMVRTADGGRATLVFDAWRRRWFLEGLEPAA